MEVPDAVLEKLKCENCENYLSRGPVLMLDDERSRCGRCFEPKEGGKWNKPYEELAKLMAFPCRYKENGCEEKLRFEENKVHEEACTHKVYLCPIAESGKCDWSGVRGNLLEHCKTKHPDNVLENPMKFKHNITKSSLGNYLLFAYQVLFLVQTKVCTVTRKIYHSVRLFGDPTLAVKYSYDIDISNENDKLVKCGKVVSEGCLALQEDTSVTLDINGLLAVLGGFKDTIFRLTVRSMVDSMVETKVPSVETKVPIVETNNNDKKPTITCVQCKSLTEPVYRDDQGWKCATCAPAKRLCKYNAKGCTYMDYNGKCEKHESYYCSHGTWCTICKKTITQICLIEHYTETHGDITFINGQMCNKGAMNDWKQTFIIKCKLINAICYFTPKYLHIRSSLPSEQLCMYNCIVKMTNTETGNVCNRSAMLCYHTEYDWAIYVNSHMRNLITNSGSLQITFSKINPRSRALKKVSPNVK